MEADVKQHFESLNEKLDRVIDAIVTREDLHEELRKFEERFDQKMDKRFSGVLNHRATTLSPPVALTFIQKGV